MIYYLINYHLVDGRIHNRRVLFKECNTRRTIIKIVMKDLEELGRVELFDDDDNMTVIPKEAIIEITIKKDK